MPEEGRGEGQCACTSSNKHLVSNPSQLSFLSYNSLFEHQCFLICLLMGKNAHHPSPVTH